MRDTHNAILESATNGKLALSLGNDEAVSIVPAGARLKSGNKRLFDR